MKITIEKDNDIVSISKPSNNLSELIGSYLSLLFVLGFSESEIENHILDASLVIKNNQQKNEPTNKNVMPLGL